MTANLTKPEEVRNAYALARTPQEYERLRTQSRTWEPTTARLLDRLPLVPGSRCLDAGCGPGETMRLMAERVGPSGYVLGIDVDAMLGAWAAVELQQAGHCQCDFARVDVSTCEPIPGEPFDLVYARLLLFHLPERIAVLRRLWDAVAPGGYLLVQDYDVRTVSVLPALDSVDEFGRMIVDAFLAAGCDVHVGARLPELFGRAGIGTPDGTDVAGRIEPLAQAQAFLVSVYQSVAPGAMSRGILTQERADAWRAAVTRDAERFPGRPLLWPLLIGAWKRKAATRTA
jgi:ubiquinone/menaquinone biosynthesis C-methylase UbiE